MGNILENIKPREATLDRWNAYVVADFGTGDLAFAEVAAKLRAKHGGLSAEKISVPPFSTLSTGFVIRQLGIEGAYPGMIIYSNTAPRGTPEAIRWEGDERQRLLFAVLKTGVPVVAISTGFNWSFVKDEIAIDGAEPAFFDLNIPNTGSQFRSRDLYPEALARILARDVSILGPRIRPDQIPNVPLNCIAYIDGYGNIKTTTRRSQFPQSLQQSRYLQVRIGSAKNVAYNLLSGMEAGIEDIGITAGSSGGEDPYIEIYKRGGSAAYSFGSPMIYDTREAIEFTPLNI